ncbi:MAG: phytoene/squalene synthase family protein [Bacteroidetes bacterium]|nr:phytoene/squalene synthase family protein [Bacteroidota bacterium]
MKALFDKISVASSKIITRTYSTSFSIGIHCLSKRLHEPIYNIYGFVRLADEIVDSFHDYDKKVLLAEFRESTYQAIERRISLNPVLNSFQKVVHEYNIDQSLIDCFLDSMEMDLSMQGHSVESYSKYILGSAQVVGLMCLRVFTEGNDAMYHKLTPAAMKLGAAFQKVNFLRDLKDDNTLLGRIYFPGIDLVRFTENEKKKIEAEIDADFKEALEGIRQLPATARFGVYTAYVYYRELFNKIRITPPSGIMNKRIRIPDYQKMNLLAYSYVKHCLKII